MLLQVDSSKASYTEYYYESGWLLAPIAFLLATFSKVFRFKLPPSTDIPPVDNLLDHLLNQAELDEDQAAELQPLLEELQALGFHYAGTIGVYNPTGSTRHGCHVLYDPQRQTIAWLRSRHVVSMPQPLAVSFYSLTGNGNVVATTVSKRDLFDPPAWNTKYFERITVEQLLQSHLEHLNTISTASFRTVNSADEALALLQYIHAQFIDYQIDRQVFQRPVEAPSTSPDDNLTELELENSQQAILNSEYQEYILAVREIENKQTHWFTKLVLLAASIAAFVAMGIFAWDWQFVISLIPILFVHEMGHFVAMKMFGYRNVQMFFIPLFGAGVSGRHYNIPAWKKAIVALAGPVPSIFLAICLGTAGMILNWPWTESVVGLTLVLNVLNLLPFLPLDGGWVAHATLFSRSAILDLIFRIITVTGLAALSLLSNSVFLYVFTALFFVSLMTAWKTAKIVQRLRSQPTPEPGNDQVPVAAIELIVPELKAANLSLVTPKHYAQQVIAVYESVITRPPGVFASIALLGVHAMTFIGAIVFAIVMAVYFNRADFGWDNRFEQQTVEIEGQHQSRLAELAGQTAAPSSETDLDSNDLAPEDRENATATATGMELPSAGLLLWEFDSLEEATQNFSHLTASQPSSIVQIGRMVFASVTSPLDSQKTLDSRLDQWIIGQSKSAASHDNFSLPILTLTFDTDQDMQNVIQQLQYSPNLNCYCLGAWQTADGLATETLELRTLLNEAQRFNWMTEAEEKEWRDKSKALDIELEEVKDVENKNGRWSQFLDQQQAFEDQRRDQWFTDRLSSANDDETVLLNATLKWHQDESRQLSIEQLLPAELLDKLGRIPLDDPRLRTCVAMHVLPPEGLTVRILLIRAPDPAAALESLHSWLKKLKTRRIELTIFTLKD